MPRLLRKNRGQGLSLKKQGSSGMITTSRFVVLIILLSSVLLCANLYLMMNKADGAIADTVVTAERSLGIQPAADNNKSVEYHIIFSTGCSDKQSFQAYIFFFHALQSKQPGTVWRIAACPNEESKNDLMAHHKRFIEPMSPNFKIHVTPDFSNVKPGVTYPYFNKPFSTHHWMEQALGYTPQHTKVGDNPHDEAIVILCDPDQIIMRPFTNNRFDVAKEIWGRRTTLPLIDRVTHGKPMGQMYGFFNQWYTKTNITRYVPKEELPSPISTMKQEQLDQNYHVGPPYMATAHDFYKIVTGWKNFVPLVHDGKRNENR